MDGDEVRQGTLSNGHDDGSQILVADAYSDPRTPTARTTPAWGLISRQLTRRSEVSVMA